MSWDDTSSAATQDQEPFALYEEDDCDPPGSCDSESDDSTTGGSHSPLWKETKRDDTAAESR